MMFYRQSNVELAEQQLSSRQQKVDQFIVAVEKKSIIAPDQENRMRIPVAILVILMLSIASYGQALTLYIDLCENVVSDSVYDIKRVVTNHPEKKFQYIVQDYYKNGQLLTTGVAKSKSGKVKYGEFTYYHPNGMKLALGSVENDLKRGEWMYWDSTGAEISKDTLINRLKTISSLSDSLLDVGKCLCYFRESIWTRKNIVKNTMHEYEYSDGKEVARDGVYMVIDDPASYKEGLNEFYKYLSGELKYPFITRLRGKHGKVMVRFTIDENGNLLNPVFLVGLDKPTEKRIKEVLVGTSGKWNPARYKNKPVESSVILPINFKLE